MADYGFRLTRDACGKHSVPETVGRSWELEDARKMMQTHVEAEIENQKKKGITAHAVMDDSHDVVEIRDTQDDTLLAWYEIEEFEHC